MLRGELEYKCATPMKPGDEPSPGTLFARNIFRCFKNDLVFVAQLYGSWLFYNLTQVRIACRPKRYPECEQPHFHI